MSLTEQRDLLLHRAAEMAPEGAGPDVESFVARYFRHVALEDLVTNRPEDLLGAALSHRSLAAQRAQRAASVHVFTPSVDRDGWSTGHSVVEIVTDDMPFLLDSVTMLLAGTGRDSRRLHQIFHPQLVVRRDEQGNLLEVLDADPLEAREESGCVVESWMHVEIDRESDETERAAIVERVRSVLSDVRRCVEDYQAMIARADGVAAELAASESVDSATSAEQIAGVTDMLRWLADGHFTFLGYRQYRLEDYVPGEGARVVAVPGTGLGLLQEDPAPADASTQLSGGVADKAATPELLIVTKANSRATVHRPVYLDYVGIKTFDEAGRVIGEHRFLGLFAATAYTTSVKEIPYLKDKIAQVVQRAGYDPQGHSGKALVGVLENYPRDELFSSDVDTLTQVATSVVRLNERREAGVFARRDDFDRFVSVLVFIPRDKYTTWVRLKIEALLVEAYGGVGVDYTAAISDAVLARLHYVIRVAPGSPIPQVDVAELQHKVIDSTRTWEDDLATFAIAEYGEEAAAEILAIYGRAFPETYKQDFSPRTGVADLRHVVGMYEQSNLRLNLYRVPGSGHNERRFKIYRPEAISLTTLLPVFTDFGITVIDERPYEFRRADGSKVFVYDVGLITPPETEWEDDLEVARTRFQKAFRAVWRRRAESDRFNSLVLTAGLHWGQVVMIRAVAKYLRQAGIPFSNAYLETAITGNPRIARLLVELFEARFALDCGFGAEVSEARTARETELLDAIEEALEQVKSLDQDRIIRSFLDVVRATVRTNFYRPDAAAIAFKLDPKAIPLLPQPRPAHEVWVYSPRVEGVHLRFGKVARGGLRWSDRPEDFRTEVLGLVKAQMVKNVVIVPTGAKGGFFPKQLPDPALDREAWLKEGVAAYETYVAALLEITDNLVADAVVPPQAVVRHDDDDSYLVVAADKGTAAFSDNANAVSQRYGFWLDDAFAAGGSAGYDHKRMGITAKGAWESVKRHFREMGIDTQAEDFTVVGIGDMSGDVFGNGMLCSEHIRLVAAFDHRHVFLDPDPDPVLSYAERARLFALPRSSWADYDPALISAGGGVHARTAKSIPITPEVAAALSLDAETTRMTPNELIRAILLAEVDLLWNGGIGTYIKASGQVNADIGDKTNDAIRVDGADLRVKVVGEGGNLGAHQLGRIEAAMHGVRLNTDALDNSAGVDTSDHEVNIKILLGEVVRDGDMTIKARNALLASMTEEIGRNVLRNNYLQNALLGTARAQGDTMTAVHGRFMKSLAARGILDLDIEFLPDERALSRRVAAGVPLTSPELSVLVAYAKIALKADLLASSLPRDPWFAATLAGYFPEQVRTAYPEHLYRHPLRAQIIVNELANSLVNRGGITFVFRAQEETAATAEQISRAYVICREVFGLEEYYAAVAALDNSTPTEVQARMALQFRRLVDRSVRWIVHNRPVTLDISTEIARFEAVRTMIGKAPVLLHGSERERLEHDARAVMSQGVPEGLAFRFAELLDEFSFLDVVELASATGETVQDVAGVYFALSEKFGFDGLLALVARLPHTDRWDSLARGAMRDDLYATLESLTRVVVQGTAAGEDSTARVAAWSDQNAAVLDRSTAALSGLADLEDPGLAPLSVALRTLRSLVRSGSATA